MSAAPAPRPADVAAAETASIHRLYKTTGSLLACRCNNNVKRTPREATTHIINAFAIELARQIAKHRKDTP